MKHSNETRLDTDVLIVGAGPTGLALATALQRAGVACSIVDKLDSGLNTSRAAVIHAHTLEVLEELGVAGKLLAAGIEVTKFSLRDRDRVLVPLRFDQLPTRFSKLLMLTQDRTERILNDALVAAGGAVQWGHEVVALTAEPDFVRATVASAGGSRTVRARYVVGADGMHSMVRRTAGIEFAGSAYEDSFVLADVEMQGWSGRDEVMLFFSPAGLVVVAPLPGNAFRVVATLSSAPAQPDTALVQALIDARGPTDGAGRITRVVWSSRFKLHHRVADHYRAGRLLLVGDAAHVHSPAGGQGMNTGLVDACVLGRVLADVVKGRQPETHLDAYETLRRPAAEQVLKLAGRLTAMATVKSAPLRVLRNALLRTVGALPNARNALQMNLSGLSRRAAAEL